MEGVTYTCRGARTSPGMDERIPCGFDLTEIILALPEDGLDKLVNCPKCGTQISVMRTPKE